MFITRTLSGIVLVLIMASAFIIGGEYLLLLMACVSLIGMMELYKLENITNNVLGHAGYITLVLYYLSVYFGKEDLSMLALIVGIMLIMTVYVVKYPKYTAKQVMMSVFGIMYVAVMLSYVYKIRVLDSGVYLVWLAIICAWGNDTCAYLAGITLGRHGKHKMSPILSPKKSMEGFFGGIIGATALGGIYGAVIQGHLNEINNPVVLFAIIGFFGALLSVVGDLAASAIKRNYEIKDYGKLIPGHGGILDRYDSVIFTAPVVYYLVTIINRII